MATVESPPAAKASTATSFDVSAVARVTAAGAVTISSALSSTASVRRADQPSGADSFTCLPDSYGFGDAAYWMQLHEDMRKAGFYIKTVEEYCDRFAVIDQGVVWYGNINLLAKDKIDNSIMRVMSKDIAGELMEITFGDNDREVRCNVND